MTVLGSNKKITSGSFSAFVMCLGLVILLVLTLPELVFANDGTAGEGDWSIPSIAKWALGGLQSGFYNLITEVASWFTWFGGLLLNFAIAWTVIDMGGSIRYFGMEAQIYNLWEIVRDIFNLVFIFALIYIGFKIILGINESQAKRTIGSLIIAALLINFSLYITQVIIDFSNLAAYEIYEVLGADITGKTTNERDVKDISGQFIAATNLTSAGEQGKNIIKDIGDNSITSGTLGILSIAITASAFLIIAGLVFIAGGVFMIARFIALILFMIFSPIMFLGLVLPEFAAQANLWWKRFLGYAFVAPAFLFMLYLSLFTLVQIRERAGTLPDALSPSAEETGAFTFILTYIIVIGFLYASLLVAKKMGAAGADQAISTAKGMKNAAQGALATQAMRLPGGLARATSGGYDRLQNASQRTRAGRFARGAVTAATLGLASDRSIRGALKSVDEAKFGGGQSSKEYREEESARKVELARADALNKLQSDLGTGMKSVVERAMTDASDGQIQELYKRSDKARALIDKNAGAMTASQFKKIMDDDSISDNKKSKLAEERSRQVNSKFTSDPKHKGNQRQIASASKEELRAMGFSKVNNDGLLVNLNSKNMKDLQEVLTESEFTEIKKNQKKALVNVANGTAGANVKSTVKDVMSRSPEDVSKLPEDFLYRDEALAYITPAILNKISNDKNTDIQSKLKNNLKQFLNNPNANITPERKKAIEAWMETPAGLMFGN